MGAGSRGGIKHQPNDAIAGRKQVQVGAGTQDRNWCMLCAPWQLAVRFPPPFPARQL